MTNKRVAVTRRELAHQLRDLSIRRYLRRACDDQAVAGLRGKTIVFEYPRSNRDLQPLTYSTRLFRVADSDDFAREFGTSPGDDPAADRDPLLRRLGKLIRGVDLADGRERTFYFGAMRGLHEATAEEIKWLSPAPVPIILVERPAGWNPTSPHDVPPNVEVHHEEDRASAMAFASGFNEEASGYGTGFWAVTGLSR